ncbi:MAG TPA: aspartate aminotransferase family protein [Thermoanaerobaculia bacterium]|nr:aspartate aminotransferase family protein [Thermoanaerobaculia bacterium]
MIAPDRAEVMRLYKRHVSSGWARVYELMNSALEVESSGNWITASDGARYLDCGGYCVFLLGHAHPRVVAAVRAQLEQHAMSSRMLPHAPLAYASARLASIAPEGLSYVWFGSSGAEAVEAAVKLVRAGGRKRLLSMDGGYHGKSMGALSVSGRDRYKGPFEPLLPGTERVPYGDIAALRAAMEGSDGDTAVILEPLQSEAGVIIPPSGFLRDVAEECRRHNALLVFDEISCGMGRTGEWWCSSREGVVPDVLLAGKALSGGVVPVSAVIASEAAFAPFNRDPLLHTSTFSGNPLACAAVMATIDVMESEGILERCRALGGFLLEGLRKAAAGNTVVRDVRGMGLLIGVEFAQEHHAADFILEMMTRKVLLSHSYYGHKVARLTPPATLTDADAEQIIAAAETSLRAVEARHLKR